MATDEEPWFQLASWTAAPGGIWKLVTACEGDLSPGDTAATLLVEGVDGSRWETPLRWGEATGPREYSSGVSDWTGSGAVLARLDVPPKIKTVPYRTFQPLPVYVYRWGQFMIDYSKGRIPLHASYEYSFTLPDTLRPKHFEIHNREVTRCHIYGIGRLE